MIVMILLSRFYSRELFSAQHVGFLVLMLVACGLVLLSGKRSALAAVPVTLVVAAFIRKEYGFVLFWITSAFVTLAAIVVLHGSLFTLPMVAQRSLSWLPGRWDPSLAGMKGGRDEFRVGLRELAIEKIKRDPWIGTGYAVDRVLAGRLNSIVGFGTEKLVLMMATGSSWHNTWLGYAADFGIPGSVLQGVIYLYIIWIGWRLLRRLPEGSMMQVFVFYVVLHTFRDLASSHHDGHSSLGPYLRWWMYAIVIAIHLRQATGSARSETGRLAPAPARSLVAREPRRPVLATRGSGKPGWARHDS
jgi:O-antigen ligase